MRLIEPFRIYGEQTATYLFTGKKMKDDYFDTKEGNVSLNQTGKPVVVEAMNRHLDETVRFRKKNVKRRFIVQHEAHRLANILLTDSGEKRPEWLEMQEDFRAIKVMGQGFDKKLVNEEMLAQLFSHEK